MFVVIPSKLPNLDFFSRFICANILGTHRMESLSWVSETALTMVICCQEAVPEDIENVASFEPPLSPESSYNSWPLGSEDFSKEPPAVPPHLLVTLLNSPSFVDSSSSRRPQRVVLNHLYIQKGKGDQPLVALGVTHRFLSKYVTVVLYKALGGRNLP